MMLETVGTTGLTTATNIIINQTCRATAPNILRLNLICGKEKWGRGWGSWWVFQFLIVCC